MSADRLTDRASAVRPGVRADAREGGRSLPDTESMRRWLSSDAVVDRDGAILSWSNPRHPGYRYPEAGGLFLSTICALSGVDGDGRRVADRVAGWLCRSVGPQGGVGRGETTYLFDSAIVLAGLLRYRSAQGAIDVDAAVHGLRRFVVEQIAARAAVLPAQAASDGRWSTEFGAHLLKCLHALHLHAQAFRDPLPDEVVAALIDHSGHQPSPVYVHPFCYEQEGHVLVAHYGLSRVFEPIEGALEWLAALQQPHGGILAFANGMEGFGEARSDATAQAVRLWLLGDRKRYAEPIARALAFLAACQVAQGGIRYSPERDDVCSWSTMFTLQAVDWFIDRPRIEELL